MFIKGDPASVNTLAGAFDSLLSTLSTDTTDLSKTVTTLTSPDGWSSAASQSFVDAWQRDADTSAKLGAMVSGGRDALRKLGKDLGEIITEANRLIASAEHQGFTIDDDGTVRFTRYSPTPHGLPPEDRTSMHEEEAKKHAGDCQALQRQVDELKRRADAATTAARGTFSSIRQVSWTLTSPTAWTGGGTVDRKAVDDAANALKHGSPQDILNAINNLNGAELDMLIRNLDPDSRKRLLALLSLPWGGLSDADRKALADHIMQNASLSVLDLLGLSRPRYDDADGYWDGVNWWDKLWGDHPGGNPWTDGGPEGGELFTREAGDSDIISENDIHQGYLGDCYFLASLGAIAKQNPDIIRNMIKPNANGTYTVTFYKDGKPVEITVTPEYPHYKNGGPVFANPAEGDGNAQEQWPLIVEKAYAQYKGTYGDIEGGWPHDAMTEITGQPSHSQSSGDVHSAGDVQHLLDQGQSVCANTKGDSDKEFISSDPKIVAGHSYMVVGTHDGKVVLRNPWGDGASAPTTVEITVDQFHQYFDSLDSNPAGR